MPTLSPLAAVIALSTFAALGYTAWYVLACAVWPFRRCARCHATGKHLPRRGRNRFGRVRACRRCRGTGHHVRAGRRAWTWLRREHHEGTRPTTTPTSSPGTQPRPGEPRPLEPTR